MVGRFDFKGDGLKHPSTRCVRQGHEERRKGVESVRQRSKIYTSGHVFNVFGKSPFYDYSFKILAASSTIRMCEKCILQSNFNVKRGILSYIGGIRCRLKKEFPSLVISSRK